MLNGQTADGRPGIAANFEALGLARPERLVLGDMARFEELFPRIPPASSAAQPSTAESEQPHALFDAIVTDPPYGLMEGH